MDKIIALMIPVTGMIVNQHLIDLLEAGKEFGVQYNTYTWNMGDLVPICDAAIFLDMQPEFGDKDTPFVVSRGSINAEEADTLVQELADYMFGDKEFTDSVENYAQAKADCPFFTEDIYKSTIVPLSDIGFNADDDTVSVPWDFVVVEIEGKDVKLSKKDILDLAKVYNLMKEFGYQIKEVVCTPS